MAVSLDAIDISQAKFTVPTGPSTKIYDIIRPMDISDYTAGSVEGTGVFDVVMRSLLAHLKGEYDKGRITGAEYAKTFIELTQAAMTTSLAFITQSQQTYWVAQAAQVQVINGLVGLETSRTQYAVGQYNFETTLPQQTAIAVIQTNAANYNLTVTLPLQTAISVFARNTADYTLTYTMPAQVQMLTAQKNLLLEQTEFQRAHTQDTRIDGITAVAGAIGKQKALYTQQITSYQRDSEVKSAKLFVDAWIVQKTIDEGIATPAGFDITSMGKVLSKLKTVNGFVDPITGL